MENTRKNTLAIDEQFVERWSSRQFNGTALTENERAQLFEAARWSPSCFNEQPWFFLLPENPEKHAKFLSLLMEGNRAWVEKAGLLCYQISARHFRHNDKPNHHYAYDAGAAWMALALRAHSMGLSAHAMAGFDTEKSYSVLGVDKSRYEVLSAIAIGWPLEEAKQTEERTERKSLSLVHGTKMPAA